MAMAAAVRSGDWRLGAYYASTFQDFVYQTTTKIMVMSAPEASNGDTYASTYVDYQLATTYSQLIATEPVINELSDRLGYTGFSNQIKHPPGDGFSSYWRSPSKMATPNERPKLPTP